MRHRSAIGSYWDSWFNERLTRASYPDSLFGKQCWLTFEHVPSTQDARAQFPPRSAAATRRPGDERVFACMRRVTGAWSLRPWRRPLPYARAFVDAELAAATTHDARHAQHARQATGCHGRPGHRTSARHRAESRPARRAPPRRASARLAARWQEAGASSSGTMAQRKRSMAPRV